jgi:formate-dependent phosphoribosylglycinamide formyltransferase (GAR transformylase)
MTESNTFSNGNPTPTETNSIQPGGVVGILGGGQLGRMLAIAARRMGYRVHAYEPQPDCPAGQICDVEVNAPYSDLEALKAFAHEVDVISFEFENIPLEAVEAVDSLRPVRPRGEVLHICQNREREKNFLQHNGIPCAPFRVVDSAISLSAALKEIGTPAVLKTADFGYERQRASQAGRPMRCGKDLAGIRRSSGRSRDSGYPFKPNSRSCVREAWMDR